MPYTVYRIEKDQSETVIGYANHWTQAMVIINADRDNIDFEAGYHWKHEEDKHEPE